MSVSAASLRQSGRHRLQKLQRRHEVRPANLRELQSILGDESSYPSPYRIMGAGTAATDCNDVSQGTVIDMTSLDAIINVDAYNDRVTVQAGARIGAVAEQLAKAGLEFCGHFELQDRTIGGAIAGGCIGVGIADDSALFGAQVLAMTVVTPGGELVRIDDSNSRMLKAFRLSFGMLGVIVEATLRVRPIRTFIARHRACTTGQFAAAAEKLANTKIGVKFYLMPFSDRVYLDLRQYSQQDVSTRRVPWKIKEWGESTVLPHVFKSIGRVVPVAGARYGLIDKISRATQNIVSNRLVGSGSGLTAAGRIAPRTPPLRYTTWLFAAADFAIVVRAYVEFCRELFADTGFRCDMPTVGYRLNRDPSALLSPAFDEPLFALRAVSAQGNGWEDFVIDFANFAEKWGGLPLVSQTRGLTSGHANTVFHQRLAFFSRLRRQLDPDNRLLNPYLSQYCL